MTPDNRLVSERFPRASRYHPEWVLANASGGANSLWVTEWLATALELREVIVARLWGGLTFEEIAQLVGCSLPTAHRRYHVGLTELRERMDGQWMRSPRLPAT